jgi:putative two-component system hydrogenase maturation factor HypX/HoxX
MRILLLSSSYNSLTQNAHVALAARGHAVHVAAATKAEAMRRAVHGVTPDLIVCPMLAQMIPRDIWTAHTCLVVHPGIVGDRGAHSLDWAILNGEQEWGVTVVQAAEHPDAGPIWATCRCRLRDASKSSVYRDEIARAAIDAMLVAIRRFESGLFVPAALDYSHPNVDGRYRPLLKQEQRRIDWACDRVATIRRKIRSADGMPGVVDEIDGERFYLYDAHEEGRLVGRPGEIVGRRHGAVCRAAVDGAVWVTHLRRAGGADGQFFKLPATEVLADRMAGVPELPLAIDAAPRHRTYRDIWYEERNGVGYVHFRFYNGAMSTDHCRRLAEAIAHARRRPTRVIVLAGGRDFWSNGIHLNVIEAADDPAEESWRNINAMNDVVHAILTTDDRLTIAALYGSAGAGGVMLALAADRVLVREGIVLNPHYKGMGGLYGSEYWTYTLPKRVGAARARELTERCLPVGVEEALSIGLVDDIILRDDLGGGPFEGFRDQVERIAEDVSQGARYGRLVTEKQAMRQRDERLKPLADYRREELQQMSTNFWGDDRSYHIARAAFVRKRSRGAEGPVAPDGAAARRLAVLSS